MNFKYKAILYISCGMIANEKDQMKLMDYIFSVSLLHDRFIISNLMAKKNFKCYSIFTISEICKIISWFHQFTAKMKTDNVFQRKTNNFVDT